MSNLQTVYWGQWTWSSYGGLTNLERFSKRKAEKGWCRWPDKSRFLLVSQYSTTQQYDTNGCSKSRNMPFWNMRTSDCFNLKFDKILKFLSLKCGQVRSGDGQGSLSPWSPSNNTLVCSSPRDVRSLSWCPLPSRPSRQTYRHELAPPPLAHCHQPCSPPGKWKECR